MDHTGLLLGATVTRLYSLGNATLSQFLLVTLVLTVFGIWLPRTLPALLGQWRELMLFPLTATSSGPSSLSPTTRAAVSLAPSTVLAC